MLMAHAHAHGDDDDDGCGDGDDDCDDGDARCDGLQVLVDEEVEKLELPCKLANFLTLQAAKSESINAQLRSQWVPACEAHVHQELQSLHNFSAASTDMELYAASRAPRVLKQLALLMQDELRSLVLTSMRAYLKLLGHYATPAEELGQPVSEWVHALPQPEPPLLRVMLRLGSGGEICFDPPLASVEQGLTQVLMTMISSTEGIPALAHRVMHMLNLPEEHLATLCADDKQLLAAKEELASLIAESMQRPNQLLELFLEYAELAQIDDGAYLKEVCSPPSHRPT